MEHDLIDAWISEREIEPDLNIKRMFAQYADLIFETNKRFNITGFKSKDEIIKNLILESLNPIYRLDVPRGTCFVDIGSGAGIPGIPIGIFFNEMSGLLIESNRKKADFISHAIFELGLEHLNVICDRAETVSKDYFFRESFDFCFARAFAPLYVVLEICSPFLKMNGQLYVYSDKNNKKLSFNLLRHAEALGLSYFLDAENNKKKHPQDGLTFIKVKKTDKKYPRRFAIIKRESKKS